MRKSKFLTTLLLAASFVQSVGANDKVIKHGLSVLTNEATNGPEVECSEDYEAPLSEKFFKLGADCTEFVEPDGSFGKLGKVITSHIASMGPDTLFHASDLPGVKAICPKWQDLNKEQRDYFWVWLFASISWKESTCGASTTNHAATHGTASGILQLNHSKKDRAWRGGESGDSCAVKDITKDENNLRCGLEILHEQLKGKEGLYEGDGNLFGRRSNSYWQHMRLRNGGKIIEYMKDFPFCK